MCNWLNQHSRAVERRSTPWHRWEAFGNQIEFGLHLHRRVSARMAKVLIKELDPIAGCLSKSRCWQNKPNTTRKLAAQTHIPLAAGERMFTFRF
ncbi:hypothetical protein ACLK1S_22825 [Escherichia coli]